ncbi:hypothetical protein LCGC14_0878120 [marine sediment metagenome]|uniref:Uncharacterized protein n=1 Tax=marine sediment metagenome TaxID=412755 RepID=A0A0F9P2P2_9ZZZZ
MKNEKAIEYVKEAIRIETKIWNEPLCDKCNVRNCTPQDCKTFQQFNALGEYLRLALRLLAEPEKPKCKVCKDTKKVQIGWVGQEIDVPCQDCKPKEAKCDNCDKPVDTELEGIVTESGELLCMNYQDEQSVQKPKEDVAELREKLAELAHKQWSGWIKYMFGKCLRKADGTMLIPEWGVTRWQRQAYTPYNKLSEKEQESDRAEADKFLALLTEKPIRDIEKSPVPCPKCRRVDGLMWDARPKIWRCVWKDCEYIERPEKPCDKCGGSKEARADLGV